MSELSDLVNEIFDTHRQTTTGEDTPYNNFVDWFEWLPTEPSFQGPLSRLELFIVDKLFVFEEGILSA